MVESDAFFKWKKIINSTVTCTLRTYTQNILPGSEQGSSDNMPWRGAVEWPVQVQLFSPPPLSSPPPWPGRRQRKPGTCGWAGNVAVAGAVLGAWAGGVAQWSVPHWEHRWEDPQRCGRWSSGWGVQEFRHKNAYVNIITQSLIFWWKMALCYVSKLFWLLCFIIYLYINSHLCDMYQH